MDRLKKVLKKMYDIANVTRILLLALAQDSGVPHKTFGPPCHTEQPDQHAHTKPGSGLGSKPATVCAPLLLYLTEISSCNFYVGGKNSSQSVDVFFFRSKDIETLSGNGDMAFQAVRIQQSVVEFILNHREQIFSSEAAQIKPKEGMVV